MRLAGGGQSYSSEAFHANNDPHQPRTIQTNVPDITGARWTEHAKSSSSTRVPASTCLVTALTLSTSAIQSPNSLRRNGSKELTTSKLDMLETSGNWRVVHFLWHHGDSRHLSRLIQTKPLGAFWERCTYLEDLLKYIKMCSRTYAVNEIQGAAEYVLRQAESLEKVVPDENLHKRLRRIIESATDLRSSTR